MTPAETAAKLRHFNDWRRDCEGKVKQPDPYEIGEAIDAAIAMIDRLEAAEKDNALKEKLIDRLALELNWTSLKRDALSVDVATLQQMLHSIKSRLEAAEKSDAESIAMYRRAQDERDALRAKIERMEKQEPVAEIGQQYTLLFVGSGSMTELVKRHGIKIGARLYALPGAKGEEK